jgi:hypothetical protein
LSPLWSAIDTTNYTIDAPCSELTISPTLLGCLTCKWDINGVSSTQFSPLAFDSLTLVVTDLAADSLKLSYVFNLTPGQHLVSG